MALPIGATGILILVFKFGFGDRFDFPWPGILALLPAMFLLHRAQKRLHDHVRGTGLTPPNWIDWVLGWLAITLSALWLVMCNDDARQPLAALLLLLSVPWMRAFGVDRHVTSGNPFSSSRLANLQDETPDIPRRLWVENAVGLVSALVFIVLSYTYFVEAFRIPTGSMEPTLYGDPVMGDRAMVDKQTYQFTEPKRGDIAVFRFPQNRAQPYVKRIAGQPSESLLIARGDLWIVDHAKQDIRPWQKHRDIGESGWLNLLTFEGGDAAYGQHFKGLKGRATANDGVITLEATTDQPAEFRFPREGNITNRFPLDGTPKSKGLPYDTEVVGDVRVSFDFEASEDASLTVMLNRSDYGPVSITFVPNKSVTSLKIDELRDPSKPGVSMVVLGLSPVTFEVSDGELYFPKMAPWSNDVRRVFHNSLSPFAPIIKARTDAGKAPNLKDPNTLIELANAIPKLDACHITFTATGGRVTISNLKIDRDFHYLGRFPIREGTGQDGSRVWQRDREPSLPMAITLADDEYLMLGDHTEDSADSRAWILADLKTNDGKTHHLPLEEIIRMAAAEAGGDRWYARVYAAVMQTPGAESRAIVEERLLDAIRRAELGQALSFTDTHGIPRHVPFADVASLTLAHAPGVPRQLIDGKLLGSLFPRPRFVR